MSRLGRFARLATPLAAILLLAACARSHPPAPVEFRTSQGGSGPVTRAPVASAPTSSSGTAAPVQMAAANVARPQTHKVQKGETIYTVARRYGVENGAIVRANSLPPPYKLEPGQVLNIPAAASPPPAVETAATNSAPVSAPAASSVAIPTDGVRRGGIDSAPLSAPGRTSATSEAAPVQTASAPAAPPATQAAPEAVTARAEPTPAAVEPIKVPARPASPVIEASANATASRAVDPEIGLPPRGGRAFQWPLRGQIVSDFGAKTGGLHNDGINIAAARGTAVRAAESGVVVYAGNEVRGFGNLLLVRHADGWMTAYAHVDEMLVGRDDQVRRGQTIAKVGRTGNVTTPQLHFEIRKGTRSVNPRDFLTPETASLN